MPQASSFCEMSQLERGSVDAAAVVVVLDSLDAAAGAVVAAAVTGAFDTVAAAVVAFDTVAAAVVAAAAVPGALDVAAAVQDALDAAAAVQDAIDAAAVAAVAAVAVGSAAAAAVVPEIEQAVRCRSKPLRTQCRILRLHAVACYKLCNSYLPPLTGLKKAYIFRQLIMQ